MIARDSGSDGPSGFPPFSGFPAGGLAFLRRLRRNNTRRWFAAHRTEYEELVRFPMQCLIAALAERMQEHAPELSFHPTRSIFRIHRDVRFSRDKRPYKTNIAASFNWTGRKKTTSTPGLYVGIEPGSVFIGGGLYMPDGAQVKAIRKAMTDDPGEYLAIVTDPGFRRRFGEVQGERLSRAPLGYPPDHPMIQHLRHKQFYIGVEQGDESCRKSGFVSLVAGLFTEAMPFVRWLARAVR